jgi:hypothetical protein
MFISKLPGVLENDNVLENVVQSANIEFKIISLWRICVMKISFITKIVPKQNG